MKTNEFLHLCTDPSSKSFPFRQSLDSSLISYQIRTLLKIISINLLEYLSQEQILGFLIK